MVQNDLINSTTIVSKGPTLDKNKNNAGALLTSSDASLQTVEVQPQGQ